MCWLVRRKLGCRRVAACCHVTSACHAGKFSRTWCCLEIYLMTESETFLRVCVLSHFSCVWLFATLWTIACQAPLSMGLSRKECWSGSPCPPPGNLSDPGIKPIFWFFSDLWRACSQFWVPWNRLPGCKPRAKSASLASIPLQDSEQRICLLGLVRGRKGGDVPVFDDLLHVFCTWVDLSLFAHCLATQLQCRAGQGMKLKLCSWWEWREAKKREREKSGLH